MSNSPQQAASAAASSHDRAGRKSFPLLDIGAGAAALLLGLGLTYWAWQAAGRLVDKEAQEKFLIRTTEIVEAIKARMDAYELVLTGVDAIFEIKDGIDRAEWSRVIGKFEIELRYPGIQGVGFAPLVPPDGRAAHEAAMRAQGLKNYRIWPEGDREQYFPMTYFEPADGRNLRAFGYDLFSDPIRRDAMVFARDTGTSHLSGKVDVVRETDVDAQAGFLLYRPIFRAGRPLGTTYQRREALIGFAYSPFRMRDFLSGILGPGDEKIDVHIFDGPAMRRANLLFDSSHDLETDHAFSTALQATRAFDMFGRRWTAEFRGSRAFLVDAGLERARLVPIAGGIASLIFAFISWLLVSGRRKAMILAENMTKDLREAERFLEAVVENIPHMIFVKEPKELRFALFNKAGEDLLGVPRADLIGRNDYDFFPKDQADFFTGRDRQTLKEGALLDIPVEPIDTKAKGRRLLHTKKVPILDKTGMPAFLLGISEDITEKKRLEDRLRAAIADAEAANIAKSEFLATVSHELRTPLNAIIGFADILRQEVLGKLGDPAYSGYAAQIHESALHLLAVISDVIDIANIQSGHYPLFAEPIRLNQLAENVTSQLAGRGVVPKGAFATDIPDDLPELIADPRAAKEILSKILGNAFKFTPEGGKVTLSARIAENGDLEILIADSGVGIAPEEMKRLRQPFALDRSGLDRKHAGTGLGLAIAKGLIELHGGKLSVDSAPGKGTRIVIGFPAECLRAGRQRG